MATRQLDFYRYEDDPNPSQVYTTGDQALDFNSYKQMGGSGIMGQGFADVQVRKRSAVPQSIESQPQGDPITKFNLAIMDMLKSAQGAGGNVDLFKQQRALQRTAIDRTSNMTPEELRVLSPGQQSAIRSGSVQALEPEIDAVASEIKARDSRLSNFENTLGQMREIGLDIAKNISPPKEVIEGYKNMLRMGGEITSVPMEIRSKVVSSLAPEDWTSIEQSQVKTTRKTTPTSGKKSATQASSEIMGEWEQGYIQGNGKIASVDYKRAKEWWKSQGLSATSFDRQFGYLIDKSGESWKSDYGYGQE